MEPKTWAWICRLFSAIAIACVAGISIAGMIGSHLSVASIIRTIDMCFFASLLLLAELRLRVFLMYFNFLATRFGKAMYIVFLGTLVLDSSLTGMILGIGVILLGIGYIFIGQQAKYGDEAQIQDMNREADKNMKQEIKEQTA